MAKKKATPKKNTTKKPLLEGLIIPQDLTDCHKAILGELEKNKFQRKNVVKLDTADRVGHESYSNDLQTVILEIHKENIVVRQYELRDAGKRKLLAIYVQKPQQRTFKLL